MGSKQYKKLRQLARRLTGGSTESTSYREGHTAEQTSYIEDPVTGELKPKVTRHTDFQARVKGFKKVYKDVKKDPEKVLNAFLAAHVDDIVPEEVSDEC